MSECYEQDTIKMIEREKQMERMRAVHMAHCTPDHCKYGDGDDCPAYVWNREQVERAITKRDGVYDMEQHLEHCTADECYFANSNCPVVNDPTPDAVRASDRQVAGDHYKKLTPEPWVVMEGWNKEHFIGFLRYSALKRIARWDSKDSAIQDVKKAIHELQKCVEVMESGEFDPTEVPDFLKRQAD